MRAMRLLSVLSALLVASFFAFGSTEASAQENALGPQATVVDVGGFSDVGLGVRGTYNVAEALGIDEGFLEGAFTSADVSYMFTDMDPTLLLSNAYFSVPFARGESLSPYVGAGLTNLRVLGSTRYGPIVLRGTGLSFVGGLGFDLGGLPAFTEAQVSTLGGTGITLTGGVLLAIF